jgi:hypothetical protein
MVKAELKHISPNDSLDWEKFKQYRSPDPLNDFGWFTLSFTLFRGRTAPRNRLLRREPQSVPEQAQLLFVAIGRNRS